MRPLDQPLRCRLDLAGGGVAAVVEIESREIGIEQAEADAVGFAFVEGVECGFKIGPCGGIVELACSLGLRA